MKSPTDQTLGFLTAARVAFQPERKKYDQFFKVVVDHSFKRVHVSVLRAELKSVFERHGNLVQGFYNFLRAVKAALKDDYNYNDFCEDMKDYATMQIDERRLSARAKVLLNGHPDLIAEFNALLPIQFHIALPPRWDHLPWDVLDVVSGKLDFDDLFQFSRVCANWRAFHKSVDKSNLLITSREPLLLEVLNYPHNLPCSFTSLPNQKVYGLKKMMMNMMSCSEVSFPIYVAYSSGYFVMIADDSSFLLINPFTRIKMKVIYPSAFKFSYSRKYHALLAFDKCSEEFVLVFLFKESNSLHVYQSRNNGWVTTYSTTIGNVRQSRNNGWVTYSTIGTNRVVDFVALNNKIYVVTNKAKIGVLSLNSANIEFLKLKKTPILDPSSSHVNLVKCDEELLLVRLNPGIVKKVYKIDFSTMTYVELKTLGDIALFYVCFRSCKALRNPNRWGYESNSVYEVSDQNPNCTFYNWDKKSKKKYIAPPSTKTKYSVFDWCFRHLRYEIDYSLVE